MSHGFVSVKGVKVRPKVDCGESMVKQAFKDECDINKIISNFERTGLVSHVNERVPFYGDVSDLVSYDSALMLVKKAEGLFMQMPAEIREKFQNDAGNFVRFMDDPKNLEKAIEYGIVTKRNENEAKSDGSAPKADKVEK